MFSESIENTDCSSSDSSPSQIENYRNLNKENIPNKQHTKPKKTIKQTNPTSTENTYTLHEFLSNFLKKSRTSQIHPAPEKLTPSPNQSNPPPASNELASLHSLLSSSMSAISPQELSSYELNLVNLHYPRTFLPPTESLYKSPFYAPEYSETLVISWLTKLNLLRPIWKKTRIEILKPALFAACILPTSPYRSYVAAAKFFGLFVLADDDLVETARELRIEATSLRCFSEIWREAHGRRHLNHVELAVEARRCRQKYVPEISPHELLREVLPCYVDGWFELSMEYVQALGVSKEWMMRMADVIEEWIVLGMREATLAQFIHQAAADSSSAAAGKNSSDKEEFVVEVPLTQYDNSAYYSNGGGGDGNSNVILGDLSLLECIFRQRIITIATPFWLLLAEQSAGVDLYAIIEKLPSAAPEQENSSLSFSKLYRHLMDIASIPTFLVNELLGLARDVYLHQQTAALNAGVAADIELTGDTVWTNVALIMHKIHGNSTFNQTIAEVTALHDECLMEFERIAAKLQTFLSDKDTDEYLQFTAVLSNIRYVIRGYAAWHEDCPRYKQHTIMEDSSKQYFAFNVTEGDEEEQQDEEDE